MMIDTDDLIIIESRIVVPAGISIPVVMVMTIVLIGAIDTIDTRCQNGYRGPAGGRV